MRLFTKLQRLYHTVKPLRLEQITYRIRYKFFPLRKLSYKSLVCHATNWIWSGPEVLQPSLLSAHKVCFLNLSGNVNTVNDWNNPKYEKLWLYNLHYFDDLNAKNSLERLPIQYEFVKRWIKENPAVSGNGWEPYPLSLRIVNLIKWYNRAEINDPEVVDSINVQAKALLKQLEYHILGNHLFANAKALVFVGCFLQSSLAAEYLQVGLKILEREIPEQFTEDGGHFELTPMYHCILLWDLLDLINLAVITNNKELLLVLPLWRRVAEKALYWLRVMCHPDGEVSFFNDSTMGIAAAPAQLFAYATSLNLDFDTQPLSTLITLPVSGYSRVSMPEHILLFDHASVGPDYLPGHAHADTLSVEWSVGLERVLVNSGTSIYGLSQERLRQRQTAAHNTVVVDNDDSSEVWSGFRVARRAYAKLLNADVQNDKVTIMASHDGYLRLKGKVTHIREIRVDSNNIAISDKLQGKFINAIAHWHLHPDIKVKQLSDYELQLFLVSGKELLFKSSSPLKVLPSTWHPGFGETTHSSKVVTKFSSSELNMTISIL
ncbi:heparinase II/III family protein [Alishewanella sp. 16-MA]|uniref:Heparinase II/III family protein n=1 Tax=Alishewanella maricola TaxID=2795740 RepID=A0ABS8C173_9ALTE|nr:alginate lyase family protein [Alishewanella maricola]MCB5226060.1 heparinase II/III family protein [Alishewanella maricola]